MALITREGKGSKLTIQEMDANLLYLQSLGLSGTNYLYVAASGTDIENAAELQAAYDLAKTQVVTTVTTGVNLIPLLTSPTTPINIRAAGGPNIWGSSTNLLPIYTTGMNNLLVTSDEGTQTIQVNVYSTQTSEFVFAANVYLTNVTSLQVITSSLFKSRVIIAPGYYNFTQDFLVNTENVDLVSLDGNRSVIFNGLGSINITANNVYVKGIDVQTKKFMVATNLNLITVENCKGGAVSFGDGNTMTPDVVSGTFIDCEGGSSSFGDVASGTFTNCKAGSSSFGDVASGTFTNCKAGGASFGDVASGTFNNCIGDEFSFGGGSLASGTFTNCIGGEGSFGGYGILSGKIYYSRITTGVFQTVSGAGQTRYCLDGTNTANNQG